MLLFLSSFVACRDNTSQASPPTTVAKETPAILPASTQAPSPESVISPVPTDIPPSPTPAEPLAALVNDQPIFLADYEKELSRYERAQAELALQGFQRGSQDYRTLVLDALVERLLIVQAAEVLDISVTPEMVDEKLIELQTAAGDTGNFEAWLEANQWTLEEFHEALTAEMLVEELVASITAEVPYSVEQVRARYLQVDDSTLAQTLLEQIEAGGDFPALAREHSLDRVTGQNGGDLGFFARGSLLVPSVEEVAFALEPGDTSEIITDTNEDGGQATYYLVQVIERDPQRPLTADLRYALLQQTFESWLDAQWQQATVIRLVDTDV
jgi:parvulin-like peptidyl-prolyl isomerase